MVLKYRVSLAGIKGFARVYELESDMTLYEFHKLLGFELEFPHDQLIQFKALDKNESLVARFGFFDIGYGTVDQVTFGDSVEKGITSFIYFYDIPNRKSVIITYEGEVDATPGASYPVLVETKGPNPIEFENGYVAFEDRPVETKSVEKGWGKDYPEFDFDADDEGDEEDDDSVPDDDEDDDDDEDGKEIYDENEDAF